MHRVESSHQVKYTIDEVMNYPEFMQKISDKVNTKMKELGYSDRQIRTFLMNKQLKLNKGPDTIDVTMNDRHLFYVKVNEIKAGSFKSYSIDILDE